MAAYASDLIAIAESQVGYTEKASNTNLYSTTGNTGHNNYTKYAYEIYSKYPAFYNGNKNGYAWCDLFYDWCMITAFGYNKALSLLCQPTYSAGAGCEYSYAYYKAKGRVGKTPKLGAQIFFGYSESSLYHTGMVVKFDNTYVYTIEGNSNDKVNRCTYLRTNGTIFGYGYPAFDGENNPSGSSVPTTVTTTSSTTSTSSTSSSSSSTKLNKTVQWTGTINTDTQPKSWAGDSYSTLKSVSKLSKGISVGVCSTIKDNKKNDWYYIVINKSIYGFVPASVVNKPDSTIKPHNGASGLNKTPKATGVVNVSSLNVRTWAGTKYSCLISLPSINYGTSVQICDAIYDTTGNGDVWYYVCIGSSIYGFVHSKYITTSADVSSSSNSSTTSTSNSNNVVLTSDTRKTT